MTELCVGAGGVDTTHTFPARHHTIRKKKDLWKKKMEDRYVYNHMGSTSGNTITNNLLILVSTSLKKRSS